LTAYQLRQRTYEWRSNFANVAATTVQNFWDSDPIYNDPEERRNYVEWVVPPSLDDPLLGIGENERRSAQARGVKERDKTEMSYIIPYFVDFNNYKYNNNKRNSA
jgi:hypothetical protein